jgi:hypothetical protein
MQDNATHAQTTDMEHTQSLLPDSNVTVNTRHEALQALFDHYYQQLGYYPIDPAPLISKHDSSVIFTGAGITPLKTTLMSSDFPNGVPGYFVTQPCLRTHRLNRVFDDNYIPYGQTYFTMTTLLSRPGRFVDVTNESLDFFLDTLGIPNDRLSLRSSKLFKELDQLDDVLRRDCSVEFDTKPGSYYQWEYGIEGIHGEGLTISVHDPSLDRFLDVGNVVRIIGADGMELGTEFGFGYEFLLSALLHVDPPLRMSKIFDWRPFEPGLSQKYMAYLEAMIMMKAAGTQIGHKGEGHIYKQYIKALEYIGERLGKRPPQVTIEISEASIFLLGKTISLEDEQDLIILHAQRKKEFTRLRKRISRYIWYTQYSDDPNAKEKAGPYIKDPTRTLHTFLRNNGIDPMEVQDELEKLQRFVDDGYIEQFGS